MTTLTYSSRAKYCTNPTGKKLLELMEAKQTNLAIAADVTTSAELLKIASTLGPEICVLKTHIDIIDDFSWALVEQLVALAKQHNFLLFEDRKFADIGNTVKYQYAGGVYHIADWAHITNAHSVPGSGIIEGLKAVGFPKGRGLLLLAEMSSAGNLAYGEYTQKTLEMAESYRDFVIGFITTRKLVNQPYFINFTPGINLESASDDLKQQYVTPKKAIIENGTDIIIVGRGIYHAADPIAVAKNYRAEGWSAYQKLIETH
jgi:orotidine 5'-phosphate decarboxylase subfamily 1